VPFDPICAAALDGRPVPPRRWHVPDIVPARTVTMLSGDGGTGKSLLALHLAVSTVLARPWIGQPVTAGRVLFVSAEDDMDELHRRLADVAAAEGVRLADLDGLSLKSLAGADALLAAPEGAGRLLRETGLYAVLSAWIGAHGPVLVVLDTLADLFGGDEVNRAQARHFVGMLRRLALDHDCTVLLLAHPSLSGMARGDGASGSTGWNNSVRSRLYFRRVKLDGESEPDPDRRELEVVKANYGRKGAVMALRWQDGVFVAEPGTAETGLDRMAASAKAERVFLRLLHECHANGRRVNPSGGNTYAPKVFAEHPAAEGVTKAAFRRAMEKALSEGRARIEAEGPPSRRVTYLVPAGGA
jgi:RecA-family ATPase